MFNFNISSSDIRFVNLKFEDIPKVYNCYKNMKNLEFIELENKVLSISMLQENYRDMNKIYSEIFYVGFYLWGDSECAGFIRGFLENKKHIVWVKLMLLKYEFQNKGLGSSILGLFENHLKKLDYERVYISVMENNFQGLRFWHKNDYKEIKKLSNRYFDNKKIKIMQKVLIK